jgi:hypothetical protein
LGFLLYYFLLALAGDTFCFIGLLGPLSQGKFYFCEILFEFWAFLELFLGAFWARLFKKALQNFAYEKLPKSSTKALGNPPNPIKKTSFNKPPIKVTNKKGETFKWHSNKTFIQTIKETTFKYINQLTTAICLSINPRQLIPFPKTY